VTGLKLFTKDYQRLNGDYLKRPELVQNAEREYNSAINASAIKAKYETVASEVNRLGIDGISADTKAKGKIELLKKRLGVPESYIN
jgi:hypothetical protein